MSGYTFIEGWEMVIGLEVHTELLTATKLFSAAPNHFGGEPNTYIDPVSLGLPGALPVLNEHAVELAIRAGLALNCSVEPSVFSRKNYFYPDMPKAFQISQYDKPINVGGYVELLDGTRIRLERAHLEEDTGKSTHIGDGGGRIHDAEYSLVDFNRAGVPLLEIVSCPDIVDPEQAKAYVSELRAILVAVGASDGKMEEGSLRVDANVSVRRVGDPQLGTRCEIKNVNSLRSLGRAIDYEARRQVDLLTAGETVRQETRHFNDDTGRTQTLRSKEEATDYRYFPEPDLVELRPGADWIERVRSELPMLPHQRRRRLVDEHSIALATAAIVVDRGLDDVLVEAIGLGADPTRLAIHAEHNMADPAARSLRAEDLAALSRLEADGTITATQAKAVLAAMIESPESADPAAIASSLGFEAMDHSELETLVDQLISQHPTEWTRLCEGDMKVTGFFVGQAMKATQGNADGKILTALLNERRASS